MAEAAFPALALAVRPKVSRDDRVMRAFIGLIGLYLAVTLALPLYAMMSKSIRDHDGAFTRCDHGQIRVDSDRRLPTLPVAVKT